MSEESEEDDNPRLSRRQMVKRAHRLVNEMTRTVQVRYKCSKCKVDRQVEVPKRARCIELQMWINQVTRRVSADHTLVSPRCPNRKVDMMLPVDEHGQVGRPSLGAENPPPDNLLSPLAESELDDCVFPRDHTTADERDDATDDDNEEEEEDVKSN